MLCHPEPGSAVSYALQNAKSPYTLHDDWRTTKKTSTFPVGVFFFASAGIGDWVGRVRDARNPGRFRSFVARNAGSVRASVQHAREDPKMRVHQAIRRARRGVANLLHVSAERAGTKDSDRDRRPSPVRLAAQDTALSRRRHGFKSRTGYREEGLHHQVGAFFRVGRRLRVPTSRGAARRRGGRRPAPPRGTRPTGRTARGNRCRRRRHRPMGEWRRK